MLNFRINGSLIDVSPVEVGLTIGVISFTDLNPEGGRTTPIECPWNSYNLEIFEFLHNPFKRFPAEALDSGRVIDSGYIIIEEATENELIKLRFYSNNTEWFTLIKGIKLNSLFIHQLAHSWEGNTIKASFGHTWRDGYIYPVINYDNDLTAKASATILESELYPHVFAKFILITLLNRNGFRVSGSLLNDPYFNLMTLDRNDEFLNSEEFIKLYSAAENQLLPQTYLASTNNKVLFGEKKILDWSGSFVNGRYTATVPIQVVVRVRCNAFRASGTGGGGALLSIIRNNVTLTNVPFVGNFDIGSYSTIQTTLAVGDWIEARVYNGSADLVGKPAGTFMEVEVLPAKSIGAEVIGSDFIPDILAEDFIKYVAVQFGCIIYTKDQTVYFDKIDQVMKSGAVDWTEKVNELTLMPQEILKDLAVTTNFISGERVDSINVPDANKDEEDFYTSPFSPSDVVECFTAASDTVYLTASERDGEPKVYICINQLVSDVSASQEDAITIDGTVFTTIPYAYFHPQSINELRSLRFSESFKTWMEEVVGILKSPLFYRGTFYLNPVDIANLDFSKPVFINGKGLFIPKINNYLGEGKECEVELNGRGETGNT